MKSLILSLPFLLLVTAVTAQTDSLAYYYQQSLSAYEAKDFNAFLQYTKRANELRPNHPSLSYNLACAYALNGLKEKAVQSLKNYLSMNASGAYLKDEDLRTLAGFPPFDHLATFVDSLNARVEHSEPAQRTGQTDHHFESITYDPLSSSFLLGTVRSRIVMKLNKGRQKVLLGPDADPEVFAVMGLDTDKKNNVLWLCTSALPEMSGDADSLKNRSTVFAIDLNSGSQIAKYEFSDAILGDLVVAGDGSVFISDGLRNRIYRVTSNGVEVLADLSATLYNLQGLALDLSETSLFIADYITGLYRLDIATARLSPIHSNGLYAEKGIDGLLYYRGHLIALQNGTVPKRVWMGKLNDEYTAITGISMIDQHLSGPGEPTQGVIVGQDLYYISNSAWDSYENGSYRPEKTSELVIRKVSLIPFLVE